MSKQLKIGSLFSGVAALDRAVEQFFDATPAWFVEFDKAPSKVLAHHYPGVPNYGDATAVDWANVEPIDILTGGFPCQDVSLAGARRGLRDGTRSGLWSEYAKAIDILRPKVVVIENVRGLLSAQTIEEVEDAPDSDSEHGQAVVGEPVGGNRPVLNAFGRVLLDLAELGYDTEWVGLRAADAGAPHNRFRVFCVAYPRSGGLDWWKDLVRDGRHAGVGGQAFDNSGDGDSSQALASDAYADDLGHEWAGEARRRRAGPQDDCEPAPNASRVGLQEGRLPSGSVTEQPEPADSLVLLPGGTGTAWGAYEPAIRRWEQALGRVAPPPTTPNTRNGSHRLNPEFVTWMMGWPAGWVTDPAIGLTRNEQLKACGNGVVTQQAYLALLTIANRRAAI